jgi:glycine cleavage system H protein
MPVSGTIIAFNDSLESEPEVVNSDPYDTGWMIKIEMSDMSELEELMDAAAYEASLS